MVQNIRCEVCEHFPPADFRRKSEDYEERAVAAQCEGLPDGSLLPREYPARIRSIAIASPWSENTNQRVATTPERTLCSSQSIDWEWTEFGDGAVREPLLDSEEPLSAMFLDFPRRVGSLLKGSSTV